MKKLKEKLIAIESEEDKAALVMEHLYQLFLGGDEALFEQVFERWWDFLNEVSGLSLRYSNQIYSFGSVLYLGVSLHGYRELLEILKKEIRYFRHLSFQKENIFESQQ